MGHRWYCVSLQHNTYMRDLFWVTVEAQPKCEYHLSRRLIFRKGSLLGPVVGEDKKYVLNLLPAALPNRGMGLVFWVILLEIVLARGMSVSCNAITSYTCAKS